MSDIPRTRLFERAVSALDNLGVRVSRPVTMNNVLDGIRRSRGIAERSKTVFMCDGIEQIELWLKEQEGKPLPESPDSWRTRPELKLSDAILKQLERCRETRGRSIV